MAKKCTNSAPNKVKSAGKSVAKYEAPSPGSKSTTSGSGAGGPALKSQEERILEAMGKLYVINMKQPTRIFVQNLSGNVKTKAGFDKNLGSMKKKGYVDYPDGKTVQLTSMGIQYIGDTIDPSSVTNETMQNNMKELLKPKECEIFDALLDGEEHDRNDIARKLNYDLNKLTGYAKSCGKLSSLGYAVYPTKTTIKLTDNCFPLGRPNSNSMEVEL